MLDLGLEREYLEMEEGMLFSFLKVPHIGNHHL